MRCFDVEISDVIGATVPVHVGISDQRRQVLLDRGLPLPSPLPLVFLVDTGASFSWVDEMHMRSLGLDPRSWAPVHTAQTKGVAENKPTYEVSVIIGGLANHMTRRFGILIGGGSYDNTSYDGLLGRDILNQCTLVWNGLSRRLWLEYRAVQRCKT